MTGPAPLSAYRIGDRATVVHPPDGTDLQPGDEVVVCGVMDGPAERRYLADHGAWGDVDHGTHGRAVVLARAPGRRDGHWYFTPEQLRPAHAEDVEVRIARWRAAYPETAAAIEGGPAGG